MLLLLLLLFLFVLALKLKNDKKFYFRRIDNNSISYSNALKFGGGLAAEVWRKSFLSLAEVLGGSLADFILHRKERKK